MREAVLAAIIMSSIAGCSASADPGVDADPRARPDGQVELDAGADVDAHDAEARVLVVNEVAAAGDPDDWFEVVNVSPLTLQLSDFVYADLADGFETAATFPAHELAPGAYYVQDVTDALSGFKLASDEQLWIYRGSDHVLVDGVDWAEADSPAAGSYARSPDTTGPFTTVTPATPGATN